MAPLNLVDLLAHLDFIVKREPKQSCLDSIASEAYIGRVLVDLASRFGNMHTTEQIKSRLYQEFCNTTAYPDYNLKRLFLHGSMELSLGQDVREQVQHRLEVFEMQESFEPRQLRRRSVDVAAFHSGMLTASHSRTSFSALDSGSKMEAETSLMARCSLFQY
jgi:hypothetical protein